MDDGVFRTAESVQEAQEQKTESSKVVPKDPEVFVPIETPDVDAPLALYSELKGFPFTAEFFEVASIYNDPDIGMEQDILDIDSAYISKVETGELADNIKSYKAFIKEAEKATDSEFASKEVKIRKIAEWVKFMSNLRKVDKNLYGE